MKFIFWVTTLLIVVAIIVGIFYVVHSNKSVTMSPTEVYISFTKEAFAAQDFNGVMIVFREYLSNRLNTEIQSMPIDARRSAFGLAQTTMHSIKEIDINKISEKITGNTAQITVYSLDAHTGKMNLVKENGVWKIDSFVAWDYLKI